MRTRNLPPLPQHLGWRDFLGRFDWRQGEHVSLIGPTGQGKTTLALQILDRRAYHVVLGTKPRDATLDGLRRRGYRRVTRWEDRNALDHHVLLWPRFRTPDDERAQHDAIREALRTVMVQGGWTVFADEARYLCRPLRLDPYLVSLWTQGRSLGISLVASTQRPAHVPLELYDQATHLFLWRDNDAANLKRLGGLGGLDADTVRATVARLPMHDALYVNTRDGVMLTTRAEKFSGKP